MSHSLSKMVSLAHMTFSEQEHRPLLDLWQRFCQHGSSASLTMGTGGISLGNPGGGVGGHVKVLGFVPGDDVIE